MQPAAVSPSAAEAAALTIDELRMRAHVASRVPVARNPATFRSSALPVCRAIEAVYGEHSHYEERHTTEKYGP